ncbi:Zn(II)2Cys6 transcription factor [Aspergillus alliaceus]|uniref:Zn(II)2Cys6 transcription factor n=1 Tax=Petromyces alliaceus TaxID=209559 RepID=UPI0012A66C92|nr:fungal-specific transcription factor domain-containing protein [Aspergillus alliaceus]KAB8230793.1 fungal-specific transcription factor domain-containing protein [Aspergillus alliaceus]
MFMTLSIRPELASPRSDSSDPSSLKALKPKVRTRSGCNTCRRRRVKCDESRPTCTRCKRSKNQCSYELQLQWEDDMRTAGKCHGRTGVQSRRVSMQPRPVGDGEIQRSTRTRRKDNSHPHGDGNSMSICSPPSHSPSSRPCSQVSYYVHYENWKRVARVSRPLPVLPWSVGMPDVDDVCLSFYESVMCTVGVTIDDERFNPLRSTVMRLVFRTEIAYFAVLMGSAHYLRSFERRYDLIAMQIRQRVLRGLRQALMKETWSWEDVLVPTIFLCSSAISNSCDASWVKHLTCFRLIVKEMSHSLRSAPPIPQFFISYFSAHFVLAKSLFPIDTVVEAPANLTDRRPRGQGVSWTSTKALAKVMMSDTLHEIDVWNGLSNHLLLLINEILSLKEDAQTLSRQHQGMSISGIVVEQKRVAIENKIKALQASLATTTQNLPTSSHEDSESSETTHRFHLLQSTSEAYRLAACLLLSETVTPVFLGYTPTNRYLEQIKDPVQKMQNVDHILCLANEVVSSVDYLPVSWPLWPLFIASCCCTPEDNNNKATALKIFHAARQKAPYENIPRAQTVIELLWQRRELQTHSDKTARIGRFEWESVLEFLGWQTSFA